MELYLIRHPRPDVAAGTCYGQTDVGLAEAPADVAARLRPLLPEAYALHASPLQRAHRLAVELGEPQLDDRLKEVSFGDWEGQPFEAIGSAIDDWSKDPMNFRPPNGETPLEMAQRVRQWMSERLDPEAEAHVVVGHGGPLRVIAGQLLGLPPDRWLGLDFACGHASRLDVHAWGVMLKWFNR
ncbi:alpha-ribazole phosphatase family protein [Nitrogeniibacter mangrovi]|uniref:Alpha-ribazole phosphatase family protein n=1 Tax=Nitrogeniibacter mangrovi TaxID=2016596 RepID=A0A6C1B100_9RHOO|nr:alpha-ribazole phosphatase family protein [Nitrogeniibacter mangrovi]QID16669.1 alpha-ribazole phosphatase family protein [Nitrogeniibacter mangrovi]